MKRIALLLITVFYGVSVHAMTVNQKLEKIYGSCINDKETDEKSANQRIREFQALEVKTEDYKAAVLPLFKLAIYQDQVTIVRLLFKAFPAIQKDKKLRDLRTKIAAFMVANGKKDMKKLATELGIPIDEDSMTFNFEVSMARQEMSAQSQSMVFEMAQEINGADKTGVDGKGYDERMLLQVLGNVRYLGASARSGSDE